MGEWALAEFPDWTSDNVRLVADKFRDHWISVPGQKGCKTDWLATWRNWCRNEQQRNPPKAASRGGWWESDEKAIAKGAEIGIRPLAGESMYTFKGRIQAAVDNRGQLPVPAAAPGRTGMPLPELGERGSKPEGLDLKALVRKRISE